MNLESYINRKRKISGTRIRRPIKTGVKTLCLVDTSGSFPEYEDITNKLSAAKDALIAGQAERFRQRQRKLYPITNDFNLKKDPSSIYKEQY